MEDVVAVVDPDDLDDDTAGEIPAARRRGPLIRTQRTLQVVLGLFWILDAALQFQPFMFSKSFVNTFIVPNAAGQPAVIGWVIRNIGHFLLPHIAVWNTLFALTQLAAMAMHMAGVVSEIYPGSSWIRKFVAALGALMVSGMVRLAESMVTQAHGIGG